MEVNRAMLKCLLDTLKEFSHGTIVSRMYVELSGSIKWNKSKVREF